MDEKARRSGSEKRRRTELVQCRMTPEEKAEAAKRADAAGLDLAAYGRLQMIGKPGPRITPRRLSAELTELALLRGQLGYIGNNLNQLTRLANMGDMDRPGELDAVLHRITALLDEARAATKGAL